MKLSDFCIGKDFYVQRGCCQWNRGAKYRCTDIGTRIIVAIKLDRPEDESWYNGPPYALVETVFDEFDIEVCTESEE